MVYMDSQLFKTDINVKIIKYEILVIIFGNWIKICY